MDEYYTINKNLIVPQPTKTVLKRIKQLKIPPNWENVKISKDPLSKVQVIGYDSKNREQRIYHELWIKQSSQEKYASMKKIDKKYSEFDKILTKCIKKKDFSHDCVIANVIRILMVLNIRVGNETYFEENGTCGLTTLRKNNLKIIDSQYFLNFIGKKNVEHNKHIKSKSIRKFLDSMKKIKNERLFCYKDGLKTIEVVASHVNNFIKLHLGDEFTSKDLRTYNANKIFKEQLNNFEKPNTEKEAIKNIRKAIKYTSEQLGNTPKVCKDSYIDPNIIDKYHGKLI
jgi:DNA topoisomerase-1